jgi:protein TonB
VAAPAEPAIDQGELRRSFIRGICAAVAKQERYPRLATRKGWQGEVQLRVVIDASGHLREISVEQGSGYDVLDREAVEMVKRAAPFPLLAGMKKEDVPITFPVRFRLESP